MLDMGFPAHLVQLMRNLYKQQQATVRVNKVTSEWFQVKCGVRQGCSLSPCLFNILAEQVMIKAFHEFKGGFRICGKLINNLRYADNVQELVNRVENAAKQYNMMINASKTKVMANTNETVKINVERGQLEQVDSFVYLGSRIRADGDCTER